MNDRQEKGSDHELNRDADEVIDCAVSPPCGLAKNTKRKGYPCNAADVKLGCPLKAVMSMRPKARRKIGAAKRTAGPWELNKIPGARWQTVDNCSETFAKESENLDEVIEALDGRVFDQAEAEFCCGVPIERSRRGAVMAAEENRKVKHPAWRAMGVVAFGGVPDADKLKGKEDVETDLTKSCLPSADSRSP